MARDQKLFKEFRKIHNDKGLKVGVITYESWLEGKINELQQNKETINCKCENIEQIGYVPILECKQCKKLHIEQ